MTDLTKTRTYKTCLNGAVHQHSRVSNHDDNHLCTNAICTIMCNVSSNVTNQVYASLIDSPWSTTDTGNWASKNIIDHVGFQATVGVICTFMFRIIHSFQFSLSTFRTPTGVHHQDTSER